MSKEFSMDKITALAKSRGFIFPGSEIYGGLANTWDYGPVGVELKNNVKRAWWKKFVQESKYNVGLDAAILMNPKTWVASGHVGGFADPLIDCKSCKARFRADKLVEDYINEHDQMTVTVDGWSDKKLEGYIQRESDSVPGLRKK
jgi:glycyl-tRNA synthetase